MDLNPRFRFDSYVVGPSNRTAHGAAQKVAQTPGQVYNPLLVYGRSGLGKTHLLQAVGHSAAEQPGIQVRYLTLEELQEQVHAATAAGALDALRKSVEDAQVLIIDDVQFLADQREMQTELLRLCQAMQDKGRQVLMACDRAPTEIKGLDERLASKLTSGLMVDVAPPDYETRLAILRKKAAERGMSVYPGVLESVAEVETPSVRELVGLVNRLAAYQAMGGAPLTQEAAKKLLAEEAAETAKADASRAEAKAAEAAKAAEKKPDAPPPRPSTVRKPAPPAVDEFAAFLSAVTRTVEVSLDSWRSRVGEAVMRWQGEGYRTARLEALLQKEDVPDVEGQLTTFAADVQALQELAEEASTLDPAAAGHARFRDPDGVEEARGFVAKLREGLIPPPAPTPTLTFDSYVVGAVNEPVVRAARQIVQEPAKRYNPLFLAGPSGTGKTHLLHAVGNALGGNGGGVACLTVQAFFEDLQAAIDAGKLEWWRRRYRRVDALLLDDVQLLAGKEQLQIELFNLFNALTEGGKQIVFAADAPPDRLQNISERLRTRFEGGLVIELAAPDRPMRAELVRRMLQAHGVSADDDAVDYLASRPADSARAVQGMVNRSLAVIEGDAPLTLDAVKTALGVRTPRISQAQAVSAPMPSGLDPQLAGREKLLWDWTDIADRLVEELH